MYVSVDFIGECPQCGVEVTRWITHNEGDAEPLGPINALRGFWGTCSACSIVLSYTRRPARGIEDFELTVLE